MHEEKWCNLNFSENDLKMLSLQVSSLKLERKDLNNYFLVKKLNFN